MVFKYSLGTRNGIGIRALALGSPWHMHWQGAERCILGLGLLQALLSWHIIADRISHRLVTLKALNEGISGPHLHCLIININHHITCIYI